MTAFLFAISLIATSLASPLPETAPAHVFFGFDESWLFWAGEAPPSTWPVSGPTAGSDALKLLPADQRSYPDRVVMLREEGDRLRTESKWWAGFLAPFSARSEEAFEAYLPKLESQRARRTKKKERPYSRTELVFPAKTVTPSPGLKIEGGLRELYFLKSFQVENPAEFVSLQVETKFNKGLRIYLNGEELVQYNAPLAPGQFATEEESFPSFMQTDVGASDRWQKSWIGLEPSLLKAGENVISAVVYKGQEGGKPSMYFDLRLSAYKEFAFLKAPYLQNLAPDGITVSWETSIPGNGEVDLINEQGKVLQTYRSSLKKKTLHEIRLHGLEPSTYYGYRTRTRFGGEVLATETVTFRTAPEGPADFVFLIYGDSRSGEKVHRGLAERMLDDANQFSADFVLHTGDFVTFGYDWGLWQRKFFWPASPLLQQVPLFPAIGNHELDQPLYYEYLDAPGNEAWYSFKHGHAEFFSINSNVGMGPSTEQHKWLEKALQESTATWKIAFLHHPPFSCTPSRKPGATGVRKYIVPLLEKHGTDLVFLGHDHLYGRTRDINGVMYVTSGGGGAWLYEGETDSFNEVCETVYHYVRVHVYEDRIEWIAIDKDGNTVEEYTLK
jgi:hypothetical protein